MKIMIVESPNKIKKIQAILGNDWKVFASVGHIRDLPQNDMGIEADSFALKYVFIPPAQMGNRTFPGGEERVARIKKELGQASAIYLATDPDREGEAIAWHLKESLKLKESDYLRVTFDEITESVIRGSLAKARKLNYELVHAQEARRALDRIVGYSVSPVLSDILGQRLSAGRVQSVAVRLVSDLEKRIKLFSKTDHFGAVVFFDNGAWQAEWDTKPFVTEEQPYVLDAALAGKAAACRQFTVIGSKSGTAKESPPSPFSTSLLLQAASVSLKLDPEVTTKIAQKLFEQGHISYIRTDGVNISQESIAEIRTFATQKGWQLPEAARQFKAKGGAQEAHEAIRPSHIEIESAGEDEQQRAVYKLIWERTVASQLADATYHVNQLVLRATDTSEKFFFRAKGRTMLTAGWRVLTKSDAVEDKEIDSEETDAGKVPALAEGAAKNAETGKVLNKQTKPPARFTKASLIKKLENEGIGRPATYAAIMGNIMGRGYLVEQKRFLVPTETGSLIVDSLVKAGFGFMNLSFTRNLEAELDKIADGQRKYLDVVKPAYDQLQTELVAVTAAGKAAPRFPCPKCSKGLKRLQSKDKKSVFWACSDSECKTYMDDEAGKPVPKRPPAVFPCPKCKAPLRRYQKKDKETKKPLKAFGWFCATEGCKTFMDDRAGKPVAPKSVNTKKKPK